MHDQFIKAILSDKTVAADYFQQYLPVFVSSRLDFSTLVHLPDSYLSKKLQKTMSDIVYECHRKDGKGVIKVSLLVEHKSYPDKHTPIQIGSYIFSALQKQASNDEELSIVIPVLLYHGKGKWQYQTLAGLFDNLEPEWKQYVPDFSYIYNNLGEVPDEDVERLNNRFLAASLLALKHAFEKEWLAENALRVLVLADNAPEHLQKQFMVYFFNRSDLKENNVRSLFQFLSLNTKNTIMSTADIFVEKGRKIGIEEGEERKSFVLVKKHLLAGKYTIAQIAEFADVSEAFVLKVKSEIQK